VRPNEISARLGSLDDIYDASNFIERPARSDFDLRPDGARLAGRTDRVLKPAAVLAAIVNRAPNPTIILTQRTAHLKKHAGQISFPGGGVEPQDAHHIATALRETEEEIGLAPKHVTLLGRLPLYETSTAYGITPIVGWVEPPFDLKIDAFEVDEVFEVPLEFALNRNNYVKETAMRDGVERWFYVLPYENRYIWGATAGMLINFAELMASA